MGFRILFCFQIFILEIVKNCFSQTKSEHYFFEDKCDFDQFKTVYFEIFYKFMSKLGNSSFLSLLHLNRLFAAKFLTVKIEVLLKFPYQFLQRYP